MDNVDRISSIKAPALVVRKRVTRAMSGIPVPGAMSGIRKPELRNENNKRAMVSSPDRNDTNSDERNPNQDENVIKVKRRKTEVTRPKKIGEVVNAQTKTAVRKLPIKLRPLRQATTNSTLGCNAKVAERKNEISKKAIFSKPPEIPKSNVSKPSSLGRPSMRAISTSISQSKGVTKNVAPSNSTSKSTAPAPNKRLPWDTRGKIQDTRAQMERLINENKSLKQENDDLNECVTKFECENFSLAAQLEAKDQQFNKTHAILTNLKIELPGLKSKIQTLENTIETQKLENSSLQLIIDDLKLRISNFEIENSDLSAKYVEKDSTCEKLKSLVQSLEEKIAKLEDMLRENEVLRRRQHNLIMELKGNIRVFCRVRPHLTNQSMNHIDFKTEKTLGIVKQSEEGHSSSSKSRPPSSIEFTLDHVFEPSATQDIIFEEISHLVQSVLDGFNVCVFAYGQTGSGKTYTMEGPPHLRDFNLESENPQLGVIPRSVQRVFKIAEDLKLNGWEYKMETSIVEIYNETMKDLLTTGPSNQSSTVSNQSQRQGLWLGEKDGNTVLSNITVFTVENAADVYRLIRTARRHRRTAATMNNEHSSRSHSVFMLRVTGKNNCTGETCDGTLNLVDLAGSEKLGEGNLIADRSKSETIGINKSLCTLGNVIMAISKNAEHVPYRNSKLTHLLKNSLGGNSKTLMFVNISPDVENVTETINSLRFAVKVNQCNIGAATKQK